MFPKASMEVPTSAQVISLLAAAKGTRWEIPTLLAIATGARRSEVLGLGWSAVDLDRSRVQIVRNLQRVPREGLRFFDPKSTRSRRMIVLPPFVVPQLRAWRADQAGGGCSSARGGGTSISSANVATGSRSTRIRSAMRPNGSWRRRASTRRPGSTIFGMAWRPRSWRRASMWRSCRGPRRRVPGVHHERVPACPGGPWRSRQRPR
jgi:integrase